MVALSPPARTENGSTAKSPKRMAHCAEFPPSEMTCLNRRGRLFPRTDGPCRYAARHGAAVRRNYRSNRDLITLRGQSPSRRHCDASDTVYKLSSYISKRDLPAAQRTARRIPGALRINGAGLDHTMPFGRYKQIGMVAREYLRRRALLHRTQDSEDRARMMSVPRNTVSVRSARSTLFPLRGHNRAGRLAYCGGHWRPATYRDDRD